MTRETAQSSPPRQSRRSFLTRLTLGSLAVAVLAGAAGPVSRLLQGSKSPAPAASQEFPGPDSIFHPASDPHLDPRRNQQS